VQAYNDYIFYHYFYWNDSYNNVYIIYVALFIDMGTQKKVLLAYFRQLTFYSTEELFFLNITSTKGESRSR
jgi:hypothetical protein